jgi:hypothetical protein
MRVRYHAEWSSEPVKNETSNKAMWRQMLTKELVALRDMLSCRLDTNFASIFDEFVGQHEFGLALNLVCDYLLEPTTPAASASILQQIQKLHALMKVEDDCVVKLQRKAASRR